MGLPDEVCLPLMHSTAPARAGELTLLRLIPSGIADGIARFAISGGINHRVSDILREGFNGLIETIDESSGQIEIRLDQLDRGLQVLGSKIDERAGEIFWLLQLQTQTLGRLAEQGASRHATEARKLRLLGERAYQRGDYSTARRYFRMATKVINDDFTVYRSLGHIYHRHCDRPDARTRALKCYRRAADCALPASPTQAAELRLLAAIVLSEMPADSATGTGIDGAIDECDKALSHNEHLHAARYWRAKLLSRCGNGTAAAEDLKAVVEADAAFFTQAARDPDLSGGCPETKDFIENIRQRAEHQVRPAFEMLVAAREHWLLPPDLDDQLDAATRRLVTADDADIHPAVTSAVELFGRVKRLSRSLQPIAEVQASTQALFAMAFSPDGRFLATTDAERFVKLWRSEGWTEFRQLDAHPMVQCLTFAPDGRFLVTGGLTVSLWDVSTGRKEHEWELEDDVTRRVAFVQSGRWLIWKGTERAELGGWDVKTREPLPYDAIAEYGVEFDGVSAHDGEQTVWAEAQNRELRVSRQPSGAELWRSEDHPFTIDGLAISPDCRHVVTSCADGLVRVWSGQSGKKVSEVAVLSSENGAGANTPQLCPAAPGCLSFAPSGQLAAGCGDGMVRVWQLGFERRYSTLTDVERQERVDGLVHERSHRDARC